MNKSTIKRQEVAKKITEGQDIIEHLSKKSGFHELDVEFVDLENEQQAKENKDMHRELHKLKQENKKLKRELENFGIKIDQELEARRT